MVSHNLLQRTKCRYIVPLLNVLWSLCSQSALNVTFLPRRGTGPIDTEMKRVSNFSPLGGSADRGAI